jgi:hypothetical protein
VGFIDLGALSSAAINTELSSGALAPGSSGAPPPGTPQESQQGVQDAWGVFAWYFNSTAAAQHDQISSVISGLGGIG